MSNCDAIVIKCRVLTAAPGALIDAVLSAATGRGVPVADASANLSLDGGELYAYLWLRQATAVGPESLAPLLAAAGSAAAVAGMRLAALQDVRGAAHGAPAAFHYVVETDVVPEAEGDLNDWYSVEHLPGLAAVPGTVRARRLLNLDRGPRYHSCYELVGAETLGSAPWLAVRHTPWSDRVRPNFRNTKRTMFKRVAERAL